VDVGAVTVLSGATVIVPVAFTVPHPPVNGIVYANVPDAVGVPLIVMVFDAQVAVTPAGNPDGVPIFVAPVVVCVMAAGKAVLIQSVGVDVGNVTVLSGVTVMVPIALNVPQPPVKGIV
jgi:hypothetical protein